MARDSPHLDLAGAGMKQSTSLEVLQSAVGDWGIYMRIDGDLKVPPLNRFATVHEANAWATEFHEESRAGIIMISDQAPVLHLAGGAA